MLPWPPPDSVLEAGERWLTADAAANRGDPYWPTNSTIMSLLDTVQAALASQPLGGSLAAKDAAAAAPQAPVEPSEPSAEDGE